MRSRASTTVALVALFYLLIPGFAWGAAGDLDPSFGAGGKVTTDFFGYWDAASSVALQADGKIVAAGTVADNCYQRFCNLYFALARYMPDGSLDPSFGTGGKVATVATYGGEPVWTFGGDVAVLPDGKILALGSTLRNTAPPGSWEGKWSLLLVRYLPDGQLDPSFGTGGWVRTNLGDRYEDSSAFAVLPGGEILVGGFVGPSWSLTKYLADGSVDTRFGEGGTVKSLLSGVGGGMPTWVGVQPDGRIVEVGFNYTGGHLSGGYPDKRFVIARFLSDGSQDPSFGGGGVVSTKIGLGWDTAGDGTFDSAGNILAVGVAYNGGSEGYDSALARYLGGVSLPYFQPDLVAEAPSGPLGQGVYNTSAYYQTFRQRGKEARFRLNLENDGSAPDSIALAGCQGPSLRAARFFASGVEITAQIEQGTWQSAELAPGGRTSVGVWLRHGGEGASCRLAATSVTDASKADAVRVLLGQAETRHIVLEAPETKAPRLDGLSCLAPGLCGLSGDPGCPAQSETPGGPPDFFYPDLPCLPHPAP